MIKLGELHYILGNGNVLYIILIRPNNAADTIVYKFTSIRLFVKIYDIYDIWSVFITFNDKNSKFQIFMTYYDFLGALNVLILSPVGSNFHLVHPRQP